MEIRGKHDEHRDKIGIGNQILYQKQHLFFVYNRAFYRNREKVASSRLFSASIDWLTGFGILWRSLQELTRRRYFVGIGLVRRHIVVMEFRVSQ